jgi:hypothetical protein
MALDPKGKYLIQDGSGTVYVWTEALSKRKDMRPYDPVERKGLAMEPTASEKRVPIELQGKAFMVEAALHDVLAEMAGIFTKVQEENKALKEEKAGFEAYKMRLETDNLDLQEQLEKANKELAQFTKVDGPAEAPPEKKGRK